MHTVVMVFTHAAYHLVLLVVATAGHQHIAMITIIHLIANGYAVV